MSSNLDSRAALGRTTWTGPLLLVTGRSGLILLAQAVAAGGFALRGHPTPWRVDDPWRPVCGTLVDLECLGLLWQLTRAEGITIRDLIGAIKLPRDILTGLGYYCLIFPFFVGGGLLSTKLVYGSIARGCVVRLVHGANAPEVGHRLQPERLVDDLVADRGTDLSGLRAAPHSGFVGANVGGDGGGRLLVGATAQPAAVPAGLALGGVALSRHGPRCDSADADLPEDAPSSAADHGALADGYWRGPDDPAPVRWPTRLGDAVRTSARAETGTAAMRRQSR